MKKILIADDHKILRDGLKRILSDTDDFVVAGEAGSSREVLKKVRKERYDVLLLDISMPGISGIDIIKDVKSESPGCAILVLSTFPEEQYAMRALRAGASGYLTKESATDSLIEAIQKVSNGSRYISSSMAERLAFDLTGDSKLVGHEKLSDREYQVMCMIASGKPVSKIADELSLSVKTISTNRARLLKKMNMENNAEVTHYAIKTGLVE